MKQSVQIKKQGKTLKSKDVKIKMGGNNRHTSMSAELEVL